MMNLQVTYFFIVELLEIIGNIFIVLGSLDFFRFSVYC